MARQPDRPPGPAEPPGAFPTVVGIGASAGGLNALQDFLAALAPSQCAGVAFILVQHLAPDHKSVLADLLGRVTHLKVSEASGRVRVQPGCLYVIPPNHDIAINDGVLELKAPAEAAGHRRPIDFFFRSLAADQRERAIGIILSGTGSDGADGIRAIKRHGGLAIAQRPESCEFDAMPRAALATGLVDFVLAPGEMPGRIDAASRSRPTAAPAFTAPPASPSEPFPKDLLQRILKTLLATTGHDFTHYKPNTIVRRLERRMALHRLPSAPDYARFLERDAAEGAALFSDLLIGVTSFFRDPAAFEELREQAIAPLFDRKNKSAAADQGGADSAALRVWVPGCSSGEEAYSIAILLVEARQAAGQGLKIQVFATDLDAAAIERARSGLYPAGIAADVDAARLTRFFTRQPGTGEYRISKEIRNLLVFSQHNVLKDPPFSRLDLISCRNLMIYLDAEAQHHLMGVFHYSLNSGGILFLGTSETTAGQTSLFTSQDRKSKLYVRRDQIPPGAVRVQRFVAHPKRSPTAPLLPARRAEPAGGAAMTRTGYREAVERALLAHCAPVGILVDSKGEILYLHGRTGHYLEPAQGEAGNMNIRKMAREGLREALATGLHRAAATREGVRLAGLRVKTNGDFTRADLTVSPLNVAGSAAADLFLVVIEDAAEPLPASGPAGAAASPASEARITELTRELRAKEEYLRTSSEELAAANEELRSANEEMQSVNEELQSANEELETSQEELQSVNEELTTVNAELQQNLKYLSQANNDMNNLLAGTDIGTIFVDHQLQILRFTPSITRIVNLISTDVGRPVGHIVSNLIGYDRLVADLETTLSTLVPMEVEVQSKPDNWYLLRIRPYRTLENVIEGAVITFTDITALRRSQEEQRESDVKFRVLFESMPQAALFYDVGGRIAGLNAAAARLLGLAPERAAQLLEGTLGWKLVDSTGRELPPAEHPANVALRTGKPVVSTRLGFASLAKRKYAGFGKKSYHYSGPTPIRYFRWWRR